MVVTEKFALSYSGDFMFQFIIIGYAISSLSLGMLSVPYHCLCYQFLIIGYAISSLSLVMLSATIETTYIHGQNSTQDEYELVNVLVDDHGTQNCFQVPPERPNLRLGSDIDSLICRSFTCSMYA